MLSRFNSRSKRQDADSDNPKAPVEGRNDNSQPQQEQTTPAITEEANNDQGKGTQALTAEQDEPIVTRKVVPFDPSEHGSRPAREDVQTGMRKDQEPIAHPSNATLSRSSIGISSPQNPSVAKAHNGEHNEHGKGHDAVERPLIAVQPRNSLNDIRPHNATAAINKDPNGADHALKSKGSAVERPLIAIQTRNSLGDIRPHNAATAINEDANGADQGPKRDGDAIERPLIAIQPRNSLGDIRPHNAVAAILNGESTREDHGPESGDQAVEPAPASRSTDIPSAKTNNNQHQFIPLAPTHHPPSRSNLNLNLSEQASSSPQNPSSDQPNSDTAADTAAVITGSYNALPRHSASPSGPTSVPPHSPSSPNNHSESTLLSRLASKIDSKIHLLSLSPSERHLFRRHFLSGANTNTSASTEEGARDKEKRKRERERKEEAKRRRRAEGGVSWGFEPGTRLGFSVGGRGKGGRSKGEGGSGGDGSFDEREGDEGDEGVGVEVGEQGGEGCCGHGHGGGKTAGDGSAD